MENFWVNVIWSVTPTILLGILFWWIIRSILRADRKEREVYAQIEAEERAKRGKSEPDAT
jgi:hypothetical protein